MQMALLLAYDQCTCCCCCLGTVLQTIVELTSLYAHFCRSILMQMEGHSLAVGHMQRLSKTRSCPQSLPDKGQEVGRVLAMSSANANLRPREESFPIFVPPRAALAECQSTVCTSAGCRQVHLSSTLPAMFVACYHIHFALISFQECSARRRVHTLQVNFCNCTVLFCLSRNSRGWLERKSKPFTALLFRELIIGFIPLRKTPSLRLLFSRCHDSRPCSHVSSTGPANWHDALRGHMLG